MNPPLTKYQDAAILFLRVATAVNFLSAVGSRLGLWGKGWEDFLVYAAQVNSFAPRALVPWLALAATALEITFPFLLLVGYRTRWAALGASGLTLLFALAMSWSFGAKAALDYSVWVDSASALLLATMPSYRWSLDSWLAHRRAAVPSTSLSATTRP